MNQKGFAPIVIILIIVGVLIAAGGVWYWQNQIQKPEMPPLTKESAVSPIAVLSPNGGEKWEIGNTYDITWKSSEVERINISVLDYSIPDTCIITKSGEAVLTEREKFSIKVGGDCTSSIGNKFKISLSGLTKDGARVTDESDNYFSIVKEETANWKTYRNEEYGFEVKYPATWQNPAERDFATYPESGIKDAFAVEFYKNTVNGKGVSGEGFFMIISKRDDLDYHDLSSGVGLPVNSTFSDIKKCSIPVNEIVIGVENYPAKKVSISPTDKCFEPGYWYIFQNGEYSYNIRSRSDGFVCVGCDGESTTKEKFPEFYQILSTFKFIK